jgi:hypothetical protein
MDVAALKLLANAMQEVDGWFEKNNDSSKPCRVEFTFISSLAL